MKRFWAVLLCLAVLGGCPVIAEGKVPFDLGKAAYVTLQYGRTFAEVAAPEDLARLREMFSTPGYEKAGSSELYVGCEYGLRWYDEAGQVLDELAVMCPDRISYGGCFYDLSGGELDFGYFQRLLLPAYVTQDLDGVVMAVMGERVLEKDFMEEKGPELFMVEKDGRKAEFADEGTIRKSVEMLESVRVHRGWADGTVEPDGFYVLTWSRGTGLRGAPWEDVEQLWYRPSDAVFRKGGYACTLALGAVDTEYLDSLLKTAAK